MSRLEAGCLEGVSHNREAPGACSILGGIGLFGVSWCAALVGGKVTIHEALYPVSYGIEEGADDQSGDYRAGQRVDVREGDQEIMERRVDGLEDDRKHHRKSAVDEGTVDDDVYVVEAVLEDGDAYGDGECYSCWRSSVIGVRGQEY